MIVQFDAAEYTLEIDQIDLNQAIYIKVKTGMSLSAWQQGIRDSDPEAIKALYWLMLSQSSKAVVWEKINCKVLPFISAFASASKAEKNDSEDDAPRPTTALARMPSVS